jgi:hypothetical protein
MKERDNKTILMVVVAAVVVVVVVAMGAITPMARCECQGIQILENR